MHIRSGQIKDAEQITAIDSAVAEDPRRTELIDSSLRQGTVRVAVHAHEIVGYSIVNRSFYQRPMLELLMVAEHRRGEGIGRALLRDAEQCAGRIGGNREGKTEAQNDELWTSTNESNGPMQSLLLAEGYQQTGRIDNLDPGDPELVFFKKLSL